MSPPHFDDEPRAKKLPRDKDLVETKSSIMRFALSMSLLVSNDPHDVRYTLPYVDEPTGVRMKNIYWLNQARRSDVVVLNRGPISAPAWTHSRNATRWEDSWRDLFAHVDDSLYRRDAQRLTRADLLVNAALHITFQRFVPEVIESLKVLLRDSEIRRKSLFWHESWFIPFACLTGDKPLHEVPALDPRLDPWTLYYNLQVYIHKRIMPRILSSLGITFMSLDPHYHRTNAVMESPPKSSYFTSNRNCLQLPENSSIGRAIYSLLLKELSWILGEA
ncbi:hypothetical protein FISHEDRAFT_68349 [Fistulina hepatica ATCC 64428]|uniref:Uncharacterized protein n=1 Tax=Fistulina hepatica ATCC 64428 TaxID=1128425 RepID=A0A0D7AQY8_9AGAR|nr:hypothetical protein FISHEDRAFT_68349 [Fistulina hepatica ATCC 64428]